MTRTLLILVPTLLGVSLAAAALAQSTGSSSAKCGPETWSTDKMTYVGVPCTGSQAAPSSSTSSSGQTAKTPCGIETWSTDKMTYVTTPCAAEQP